MIVGVLALQGAVREHIRCLEKVDAQGIPIKKPEQLKDVDGLIIPGGESTTISKLMHEYGLNEAILSMYEEGVPMFGTCAGLILIAKEIEGVKNNSLGLLDVNVKRNAFGRQKESFEVLLDLDDVGESFPAVFIRGPYVIGVESNVRVLATFNEDIVAVRQERLLAASFHPELTDDSRMHAYFVSMIKEYSGKKGNEYR